MLDRLDLCRDDYDPTNADADLDGVGDVCDNCPSVPNPDQEDVDEVDPALGNFGDGVGDACDLCPRAFDPAQRNCNEDAERLVWTRTCPPPFPGAEPSCPFSDVARGDACDPVPCGSTALGTRREPGELGGDRLAANALRIDALAAREDGAAIEGRSGLRLCRCEAARNLEDSAEARVVCQSPENLDTDGNGSADLFLGNCSISDTAAYDLPREELPWRWVTTSWTVTGSVTAPDLEVPPTAPHTEIHTRHEPPARWDPLAYRLEDRPGFERDAIGALWVDRDDEPRWAGLFGETFATGLGDLGTSSIVWTHTPGPARTTSFWDDRTRELASHYLSAAVRGTVAIDSSVPGLECFRSVVPFLGTSLCPSCGDGPLPYLGFTGPRCDRLLPPTRIVVDGLLLETIPPIEPEELDLVAGLARAGSRVIAAAEAGRYLPAFGPRFAVVAPQPSLMVQRALSETRRGLIDLYEPSCPPPQCPSLSLEAVVTSLGAAPSPRRGARLVLAASRETLFVVGGTSESGETLHDVWAWDLVRRTYREVTPRAEGGAPGLGRVLAATYRALDRRLFVLDEVTRTERRRSRAYVRLVALSPEGLGHEVIAEWPRLLPASAELAVGPDGELWLARSWGGERFGAHLLARLSVTRSSSGHVVALSGLRVGGGVVAPDSLRVNDGGASYLVRHSRRGDVVRYVAPSELRGGALADCF